MLDILNCSTCLRHLKQLGWWCRRWLRRRRWCHKKKSELLAWVQVLDNVQQPIVITKIKKKRKKNCTQIISLASPVPKATMTLCASHIRAKIYLTYKLVCCNIQWFNCYESYSTTAFFIIYCRFFIFVYIIIFILHRFLLISASPSFVVPRTER